MTMMPGLTISQAAAAWGVHRDSVRAWVRAGKIDAAKDNAGVWRVAEGQQPPPGVELRRSNGHGPEAVLGSSGDGPGDASQDGPGALGTPTLPSPAILLPDVLEKERERREVAEAALAETRISLARAEGRASALTSALADARAALDAERAERMALAEELRLRSRPLWQRVLAELHRRRQQS